MADNPTDASLAGWYVISLRPSGTHAGLRRAATARGARLFALSTLRLRPLPAGPALAVALACPRVVFTSPAAVRFAAALLPLRGAPARTVFAVGAGTAAALRRAGVPAPIAPAGRGDSDTLLALPGLQAPGPVGVVTAPGGRNTIAETLAHRGASVHRADVYRREPFPPRADRRAALAALPARSALIVTSAEAFSTLWSALDDAERARLRARPAVASSPRLAAMLAADGFAAIVPADSAVPAALLTALAADVAAGRFR
jgi:uroporphyrinogen-III synthase